MKINMMQRVASFAAVTTMAGSALFCATGANAAVIPANFEVSYEAEAAGVENTTATFSVGGVETFSNEPVGYDKNFITDFGTGGAITGTYTADSKKGIQINAADQYGGAGGTGKYIVSFEKTPYSLSLKSNIAGGVNYFGYWLSALDKGNYVTFYGEKGQVLFTFNPADVIKAVDLSAKPSLYYGNPNSAFKKQDGKEPFVFVNFFDTTGSFSKVSFSEVNFGGGYESDNQTVGHYLTIGEGTVIPLIYSPGSVAPPIASGVPEPSTWAMMALGFVVIMYRVRRHSLAIAA
jgi:hypothetical protein